MRLRRFTFITIVLLLCSISFPLYPESPHGSLPCTVIEKNRGTAVAGASICLENATCCTETDAIGSATVPDCPAGRHAVTVAAPGYDTLVLPNVVINTGFNIKLEVELTRSAAVQDLDKITVAAKRLGTKKADQVASVTRLSTFDLENTAGTINDVNRVLQTLPSVITGGTDFDNSMVVRGGHSRENVFILDGIELENISHFSDVGTSGGSFGFIDGSLLQSLDFYAGSMPASFPARMSSVIDMTMRDGSATERNHQLHLNTSGVGFTTEGPLPAHIGSYLLCARYIDTRTVKDLVGIDGLPRFGDVQSKFTVPLSSANSLSLTSVLSYDNYQENESAEEQGFQSDWEFSLMQYATGLQWNSVHTDFKNRMLLSYYRRNELRNNTLPEFNKWYDVYNNWQYDDSLIDGYIQPGPYTTVRYSRFSIKEKEFYRWSDDRSTVQFKDDFTWYLDDFKQFKTGMSIARKRLSCLQKDAEEWEWKSYWLDDHTDPASLDSLIGGYPSFNMDSTVYDSTLGAYGSFIINAGPFKAVAGIRGDYFRMLRDYGISPRISASYEFPTLGTFALSTGLYYQEPSELGDRIRFLLAPDPSSNYVTPPLSAIELERSWQGVLSWEKQLSGLHQLVVEAYGKWYDREYTLASPNRYQYEVDFDEAQWYGTPWKLEKPDGKKKSFGCEVSFQKKQQNGLYYALGYSLSSVKDKYSDDKWYDDPDNIRNHGSLLLGFEFLRRHSISARVYFSEGRPYSKGIVDEENGSMTLDTTKAWYSARLAPVASLNLRYNFRFYPKFGTVTGYIEAWNLLNYKPVVRRVLWSGWSRYYDTEALGIIPFLGVTIDF